MVFCATSYMWVENPSYTKTMKYSILHSSFASCGASRWDAVVPWFRFYRTRIPIGCPTIAVRLIS
jgi:hypothetical protein